MSKGYRVRVNKYKKDPFRPLPHNRLTPKSRRNHPIAGGEFCIRASICANTDRCVECVTLYRMFKKKARSR